MQERRLHPGLAGLVHRVVGYDYRVDPRAVHHGVPGPGVTVIISFDEPLDLQWHGEPSTREQHWLLASGLHTRPVLIYTHGVQRGVQLDLTPAGCRALLGVPAAAIARGLAPHAELPRGVTPELHERLWASTWHERFRLLEEHLLALRADAGDAGGEVPADLAHAWRLLERHHGRLGVAKLAREVGWSRRHLSTRFAAEFGMTPQDVRRLHRFGAAVALARTGRAWADVASAAGYADQAHLSRDFHELSGQTPTQWRREVFPILQDEPA